MKCHIPGLHREAQNGDDILEGLFLAQIERALYRWHPQKPFFALRLAVLEPKRARWAGDLWTALLHPEGPVETQLVLARLWL